MGRGRGRGRGGGGPQRSRGLRRGGSGRGSSRGRSSGRPDISRKNASHMRQFGEQHPSEDTEKFGPTSNKRGKFDWKTSRGRGRGATRDSSQSQYSNSRMRNVPSDDSSESEEEVTPYDQLLAVYTGDNVGKKAIQIVSESESESEEDNANSSDSNSISAESVSQLEDETQIGSDSNIANGDDDDESKLTDDEDSNAADDKSSNPIDDEESNATDDEESNATDDEKSNATDDEESNATDDEESNATGDEENNATDAQNGITESTLADAENTDEENGEEEETVIEDAEIDPELNDEVMLGEFVDPFMKHFERQMKEDMQQDLKTEKPYKTNLVLEWPCIEQFRFAGLSLDTHLVKDCKTPTRDHLDISLDKCPKVSVAPPHRSPPKDITLEQLHVKQQLHTNLSIANKAVIDEEACSKPLTPLQVEVYSLLSEYYDMYYAQRNLQSADALRVAYCLHAANHIWKTRNRIVHHNAKLANKVEVPEAYRDQGFVRPKVLILAPFKDSALKIIQTLISIILTEEKGAVANKKRFTEEYGGATLFLPKTNPKPDDYMSTFGGNCDDNFKIGLSVTKKSVKLYTGFYSSDIIVASPLGLRMIIGAEGEKDREYDFLSSIELLIMDQADVFLMQNWDHVLHIMKHMHLQPVTTHGTDFGRIRPWALDGLTKYYCQTVMFSSYMCPEHNALFSRYCRNFSGCLKVVSQVFRGSICHVTVQLPQVFQQFDCESLQNVDDNRFDFFVQKVLPNFKDKLMSHTLVFVSSYFDFVRLRNYFKREEVSFVQICEYTKDKKIARARDLFFHNQNHFLLYTERAHFFRRFRLKGIGHIIFYQLPQNPHFYSELCDLIQEGFQNRRVRIRKNSSVNAIYCKYDAPRLSAIVGTERAAHMITSEKKVHAFVSGEL